MSKRRAGLFARLSLDYADHPKIAGLSDAAFRAHVEMILYSRRYLTDGHIAKQIAKRWPSNVLAELTSNDPDNPSLREEQDGGYTLHGYAEMQETKEEVQVKRRARAEAGRRGGLAKAGKVSSKLSSKNVAETEIEKEVTSPPRPEVVALCSHLADRIEANGSKRPTIGKGWHDAARLLLDSDERKLDEAHRLIDWCQDSEFWRSNILSMPTFRKKYDQLRLQATARRSTEVDPWAHVQQIRPGGDVA